MIFVDRGRLDDAGQPIKPSAAWEQLAADRTQLARNEGAAHQVSDLYSHVEVKKALEELFHRKCAYCEQPLGEEWDVEHYRPKGAVVESPGHPGYYWLAYTWTNLFPSCKFCNQRRKDAALWNDPRTLPAAGKIDQFPLADETRRAADPLGALAAEQPLLLDPCLLADQIDKRFTFDPQGGIEPASPVDPPVVGPAAGALDLRAETTIRICNLSRRRLQEERGKVITKVARMIGLVEFARSTGAAAELVNSLEDLVAHETRDGAYYAGAARFVVRNPAAFVR